MDQDLKKKDTTEVSREDYFCNALEFRDFRVYTFFISFYVWKMLGLG